MSWRKAKMMMMMADWKGSGVETWAGLETSSNGVNMVKGRTLTASVAPAQGPSDSGARLCGTKSNRGHKINKGLPRHPPRQTSDTAKQSSKNQNPDKCKLREGNKNTKIASILPKKWNGFIILRSISSFLLKRCGGGVGVGNGIIPKLTHYFKVYMLRLLKSIDSLILIRLKEKKKKKNTAWPEHDS